MTARTMKNITQALQTHFTTAQIPLSLPADTRRILQHSVEEVGQDKDLENSARVNVELKAFWQRYVGESPQRLGPFVGVLRELQPAIEGEANILEWWQLVVKPIVSGTGYKKSALEDARAFLLGVMVQDDVDDNDDTYEQDRVTGALCKDLLGIYIARTRGLTESEQFVAPENAQVAQQVEDALFAFGRKRPKDLLHSLDDLVTSASTRLQALTLLSAFLRHETPHLYLVIHTPLVEHLLKCLMNDTSTTVLSVALTSLIMLLPHIPGSLGPHLPRLFLIYSRLLCWEKFSSLSNDAQKSLVTDDRVPNEGQDGREPGDVGIDPTWGKATPPEGVVEATTPELMTYFTYLYGLYPLHFTNYIRKPRRYLKTADFPGADEFDLDQAVIRSRTEQYRQAHLLHPNFFNKTAQEELIDPKWPKMDPADVVGECHGLCLNFRPTLAAPGPPPTSKLPELPPIPPLSATSMKFSGQPSPSWSHASFRSGSSWRDTQSTAVAASGTGGDSPILRPEATQSEEDSSTDTPPRSKASTTGIKPSPGIDEYSRAFPSPGTMQRAAPNMKSEALPQTNLAYLQQQITLIRNDLNFERWHKAQYSQHISQITRRNVKEATVEAETLNLIQANRALKKQLDQVRKAREATAKDSALTRKQANGLETNMTERFHKLRLEQETWQADADELRRLRSETKQYRDLLVATEARELNKSHQLELVQQDLDKLQDVQSELRRTQRKLHEYEYKDFEYQTASRQRDIFRDEKEDLQARIQQHEQMRERMRQAYAGKVSELETQLAISGGEPRSPSVISSNDSQILIQQAVAESESRLTQLRKVHGRLLEKFTELELEYQSVRSQLDTRDGRSVDQAFLQDEHEPHLYGRRSRFSMNQGYDGIKEYYAPSEAANTIASFSDPTSRRFQPPMQGLPVAPLSEASVHRSAGLTFDGSTARESSLASGSSTGPAAFNQSAPLDQEEMSVVSDTSGNTGNGKKEKIQPDSTVRVYGRGGAQNIKLKQKDPQKKDDSGSKKPGGLRSLRNLV